MEKVMAMNGFEELKENELMETEGGIPIIPVALLVAGVALTLTGCGTDNNESTESSASSGSLRDLQIHTQAGCTKDECLNFWGKECPVRNQ